MLIVLREGISEDQMKKKISFILKWIVGLTILFILFRKVGILEIYKIILNINVNLFLIALLFFIIEIILGAVTMKILLDFIKKIRFVNFFKYYLSSWSIGLFTPSRVGELSIGWFLRKENIPLGKGLGIFLIDKIITVFFLSIVALIGVFWFFGKNKAIYSLIILLILFFFLFLSLYSNKLREFIRRYILRKYEKNFVGFSNTFSYFLKFGKKYLLLNAFLTVIKLLNGWLYGYFLFLALGGNVPYFYVASIIAISWLFALIPISINGLGVKESVNLFLFSQIGVSQPIILAHQAILIFLNYLIASSFLFKQLILRRSIK